MAAASSNLRRLAADVEAFPRAAMTVAAEHARGIVDSAGGPPLRGKKRGGLPVKMKRAVEIKDSGDGVTFRVQGTIPGWLWVDSGTRAHTIPRRRSGAKAREHVRHPGTSGRHTWARVAAQLQAELPRVFADELHKVVAAHG